MERRTLLTSLSSLLLLPAMACRAGTPVDPAAIGDGASLAARFDAAAGKARVVLLASPTCGVCLRGVADVTTVTAERHRAGAPIETIVAWVPMLGADRADVPEASRIVADRAAAHVWEPALLSSYRRTLGIDEPAWDIYLIYGPEARWDAEQPPAPAYWMHQLGSTTNPRVEGPYLDMPTFTAQLDRVLAATGPR